jgi:hypothetical protein
VARKPEGRTGRQDQFWQLELVRRRAGGQDGCRDCSGRRARARTWRAFRNAEFDKIYDRMRQIPDGPEREALFFKAKQISVAYMPYRHTAHRMEARHVSRLGRAIGGRCFGRIGGTWSTSTCSGARRSDGLSQTGHAAS